MYFDDDTIEAVEVEKQYNSAGVYLTTNGDVYSLNDRLITPLEDENGYQFIPDEDLPKLKFPSGFITMKDGTKKRGKYLHRMMVFTFGDCNSKKYDDKLVIDHRDMNHANNAIYNLEQISQGLNLARAYYITKSDGTKKRFWDYYNLLDDCEKYFLDAEIIADIAFQNKWRTR